MSKNKNSDVKRNNVNLKGNNVDPDEDSIESPFWFWVWMGALTLLFVGFALFNKYCVNKNDVPKQKVSPSTNVETIAPTTDQPSVTK